MIVNIPAMNVFLRNQARRFITLVDAAYDAKVSLICSAECPMQDLFKTENDTPAVYAGEEEAFAFNRAISR